MADFYDWGQAARLGYAQGKARRMYEDEGPEAAAAYLTPYDPSGAQAYQQAAERAAQRQQMATRQAAGAAVAGGDYKGGAQALMRSGDFAGAKSVYDMQADHTAQARQEAFSTVANYLPKLGTLQSMPDGPQRDAAWQALKGQAIQDGEQHGQDTSWLAQMPDHFDENVVATTTRALNQLAAAARTPEAWDAHNVKMSELAAQQQQYAIAQARADETERHNRATEERMAQAARGGGRGGAQWRVMSADEKKANNLPEAGVFQVNDDTGAIKPVSGATAPQKQYSEYASKAASLANRLSSAASVLDHLESKVSPEQVFLGGLGDPNAQMYRQAKRDFINAQLRLESGAAIGQSEFDSADKQYFPQPGDTPQVKEQKRQLRARAVAAMKVQSQGAYEQWFGNGAPASTAPAPQTPTAPAASIAADPLGIR